MLVLSSVRESPVLRDNMSIKEHVIHVLKAPTMMKISTPACPAPRAPDSMRTPKNV
jgi:hypothetical protein